MSFTAGFTSVAAGANSGYATVHTGANRRCKIRELGFGCTAATSSPVGIGTPANTPVATTSITPNASDSGDATSSSNVDTAWSTAPTAPTVFDRKFPLGAAVGAAVVFPWPLDAPLVIAKSAWKVLWNYSGATGSALDGYVVVDE